MSRGRYVTPRRLAAVQAALTAEDVDLLRDVQRMRLASATQLQRLYRISMPSDVRRFRRRLTRLVELDALTRLNRRVVGGRGAGSASYIYALGLAGQRLLATDGTGVRPRTAWTPRAAWLDHALSVSEVYVRLQLTAAGKRVNLVRFDTEPACWRTFETDYAQTRILKPDAYVELVRADFEARYFLEVDCGTESAATLSRKFDIYRDYWLSGTEQRIHGIFPQVVWLVPGERRRAVLVDVAARQPAEAWQLHRIVLFDAAPAALTGLGDEVTSA